MSWKDAASKLNSKYGLGEESKKLSSPNKATDQGQSAAGSGWRAAAAELEKKYQPGSRWKAAAAELEEKYSPEKRQERINLANDWVDRYNKVITGFSQFDQKRNGGYAADVGGGYGGEIDALIRDFGGIEDTYSGLELRDARRQVSALLDLRKRISDGNQFMAQFSDEEDYLRYLADQEAYTENLGGYEKYRDSGDFSEVSQRGLDAYGKHARETEERKNQKKSFGENLLDALAGAGNPPGMHAMQKASFDLAADTTYREPTDRWSQDERAMYGYLYETDREMADSYGLAVNNYYNKIERRKQEEEAAEFGKDHKKLSFAGSVAGNAMGLGMADLVMNGIESAARGTITEKDYMTPFQALGNATGAAAQDLNEKHGTIREDIPVIGGRGWGDAYQLANSFATSFVTANTLGPLGTSAVFFGNAAADTMYDALDRGATDDQAIALGLTAGAAEALGEYCSVSHLLKLDDAGVVKNFFLEMLRQGAIEGEEEVFTSLLNLFSDRIIMGDKSELKTLMAKYMQDNPEADEEAAKKYALKKIANDVAFDFLGGFISGEMGGFAESAIGSVKWHKQYHDIYSGVQQELYDNAAKLNPNSKAVQNAGKRLSDGKNLRDFQVRKLLDLNQRSSIEQAVRQRLNEVGESGNVEAITRAITKQAMGEGLSLSDQTALKSSSMGDMVLREMQSGEIYERTGKTAWTDPAMKATLENAPQGQQETPGREEGGKQAEQAIHNLEGKEVDAAVSEDGKTRIVSTGQEAEIRKIASIRDGNITFEMEDGSVVDAGDIAYGSEGEAILYDTVASLGVGPMMADVLVQGFGASRGISAAVYAKGMQDAFQYGKWGVPMGEMESGVFTSRLTEHQRQQAYQIGRMVATEAAKAKQALKKQEAAGQKGQKEPGKVHFDGDRAALTGMQKTNLEALETIAGALGVQIHVFESETAPSADGKGTVRVGENGSYDPSDGSIHIDLYAGADGKGTMLFTAAHELTHFIKDQSPEKFQALSDFLMEQYGKKGQPIRDLVEGQMAKARKHDLALDYDGAFEEVVADSMESMLTDGKVLQELRQRDRGLWQKVKDYVLELCRKVREAYKGLKPDSLEGRLVAEMKDAAEEMRRLFVEGLLDAGENFTGSEGQKNSTREGGGKMSIRSVNGNDVAWIEENIMKENKGEPTHQFIANYIAEHIGEMYTIIESGQGVYIGKDLPGEYTQSKYTRSILKGNSRILKAKNRAAANLGEMIEIATNRRWEKTRHTQSKDAKYGMYRYDTRFGFPVKNFKGETTDANIYNAELLIRNASDGKKYLYDIVNIKKDTASSALMTNEVTRAAAYATAQMGDVSTNSIHSAETDVKKKFSLRDQDVQKMNAVLEKQNEKLREDVASLKALLKLQKSVTGGKLLDKKSVDTAARFLMKNAGAKGNTAELSGLLNDVYAYMAGDDAISWEGIMEKAQPAADWIADHMEAKQTLDPYGAEVLREIRGSRISLDESQRAEAEYQFGSVGALRKQLFGTVTITDKGAVSLDSKWAELSELYPDVFDPNTSAADMPGALLDAIDSLKNMGVSDMWYDKEAARQDLLQQIYDGYWRVSPLHTVADVKQKQINRLKIEHYDRLNRVKEQYQQDVQRLKAEHRAEMKKLREDLRSSSLEKQAEIRRQYQQARAKSVEGRNRTAMRHKVQRVVKDLNDLLLNGTKEKHVPIELQKAVAEVLDAVNMDTVGAEDRISRLEEKLLKAKTAQEALEISRTIDRVRAMGDSMKGKLQALKAGYEEIIHSDDPLVAGAYDSGIAEQMTALMAEVEDTPLRDMSLRQLEAVHDVYTMVLTTIRNANKTFKAARNATVQELSQKVMGEVRKAGGSRKYSTPVMDAIRKFGWNNLKPVYAFELIGSDTFKEIFKNVRKGEDTWAVDVNDARDFYLEQAKKHGYNQWDMGKQYKFTATTGATFQLGLPQIMSLYAYSKREQAADHLRKGGIVIDESTEVSVKTKLGITMKFNPTEATAYNISDETLTEIVGKLTQEQKAYVDAMQEYLSTVMGEKGNEVSLQMYGIKLFGEKYYFPLKSAQQYMARAKEQQQGDRKIKNAGFSKQTVRHAGNPVVLSGFMDVWAEHVNEMSMYHAFVLPMEDFYRVWGYNTGNVEAEESQSVNAAIQNACGKGATAYIDQLLKDLNGGARMDATAGVINKSMNLFKKGAVFASMSVVIQQPSAIGRALAMIDAKYFAGPRIHRQNHQNSWQEVKKYAPVAAIKEMGYFDTNMGKSTKDYILGQEYEGVWEKAKAFFTDSGYRDEALSRGAALADEITWCNIWEAVKRETRAKHPELNVKSEAFLQMAGERFTDVIVKTQVYDSVLARSANMRSKDTGMKMATAFMAEPTTSINMVADALMKGKRDGVEGRRHCRRAIGSVVAAQILNSILVSFVYAARDDDEDETYLEKYLGAFVGGLTDSLNPATYIPFAKDIVSIVQGYDVERSDMAVVSDLWNAWKQLGSDHLTGWRKVENFAGSVCQIFGLPVRNIMRDARGMYQAVDTFTRGQKTTLAGLKYAVEGAITGEEVSDREQLYRAYLSGDEDHLKRVRDRYDGKDSYNAAMRTAIREHFLSGDIDEAEAQKYLIQYGAQDGSEAHWTVDAWKYAKANGTSEGYGKYDRFYTSVRTGKDLKAVIREYTDNGVSEYTLSRQITTYFKPMYVEMAAAERAGFQESLTNALELCGMERDAAMERIRDWDFEAQYGFSYDDRKQAYMDGKISGDQLQEILVKECGYEKEEAAAQVEVYDWEKLGFESVTASRVEKYNTYCKNAGVSREAYMKIMEFSADTHNDVDENGETIKYSAVRKIMAKIDSLPIPDTQKEAIAHCFSWKEKTIQTYRLW